MNWRDKLIRFMYGRYGIDNMWYGLLGAAILLAVLNLFFKMPLIQILQTAILVYAVYRVFSKNTTARRKENEYFNRFWSKIKLQFRRVKDIRTHVYHTCPHCGKTLRFPRKKGLHNATCPKCGGALRVKVYF